MGKNAKYSPAVIAGKAAVMVFLSQVLLSHQNSFFFGGVSGFYLILHNSAVSCPFNLPTSSYNSV